MEKIHLDHGIAGSSEEKWLDVGNFCESRINYEDEETGGASHR